MKYLVTDKQFYKRAFAIALPISAQSMITIGVNMLDTIMLGKVGETSLSAASLGNQFITFFQICCMGIGMGASVLTARYWGCKDTVSLKKTITIALRFALIFASLFTVVNFFFTEQILSMYSKEANVIAEGVAYLRWSTPTFLLMGLTLVSTNIMRSFNQVRIPLLSSICALFVNLFCNYTFIFGHFGAPKMGTAGAALGTVIARVFELFIVCGYFFFVEKQIGFRIKNLFDRCGDLVKEYIRVAIPVLISDGLLGLGTNALAMIMGNVGAAFVAANAITMATQQLSSVFIQGLAFAGSIVTGQTLGEGRKEDAQRQGYTFFWLALVIGCVAAGIIFLVRTPIISAYNVSPSTAKLTEQLMDAICIIVIFQASNSMLTKGVLRGGGDTRFLMVADIIFLWVVSIPMGALAGLVWHLPPFWIYMFLRVDHIIKAIWCVFRLRSMKWIKKIKSAPQMEC